MSGLLTKDGRLLLSSVFINSLPFGFMNVVPLVYLAEIGFNPALIGEIYAVSSVANTVGLIPFGMLADRFGRKRFLIAGSVLPFFAYVIFGLTLNPGWLIVASMIGGVGFAGGLGSALASPALLPMLAAATSEAKRTTFFGLYQGAWTLAFSIGAAFSVLPGLLQQELRLGDFASHAYSYEIMAVLALVSVVPLVFVHEPDPRPVRPVSLDGSLDRYSNGGTSVRSRRSWSVILKLSIVFGTLGLALGVLVQLLPTWYALKFGASEDAVGLWTALADLTSLVAILMIPFMVKRLGTLTTIAASTLLNAAILAMMSLSMSFDAAAALFVFRCIFANISWPVLNSYAIGVVSEEEGATMIGVTYTAWAFFASVGTFLGGWLLGIGQLSVPFVIGVGSYAFGVVAVMVLFRRLKPREEASSPTLSPPSKDP
jgi:MFS family permease